ncbi:MAG: hypothetical protein JNL84_14175 [Candidatus Accumulibacter sp.]|nr:hypothetical protein [Accumulibacter sp.]
MNGNVMVRHPRHAKFFFSTLAVAVAVIPTSAALAAPIAGLAPYQRPVDAPVIQKFEHPPTWNERALHGITEPVPASFKWLQDQGAWYTPFNLPGMPGYYDLRGWHSPPVKPPVKNER